MIVEYLKATAEDPNPEVFLEALGDVARISSTSTPWQTGF
ncbi:MAG: hypothetical protein WBP54_05090 [Pelodictyon phaeoclathratiforme]|jgi:DNA-binding phage protein